MNLSGEIREYIRKKQGSCEVFPAPFAVFLYADDKNYVEPDISVICDKTKLDDRGCNGAPDWIIEITSPSNPHMDYDIKLFKYRTAGVREYWIVNPRKENVMVYGLENGEKSDQYDFAPANVITPEPFFSFDIYCSFFFLYSLIALFLSGIPKLIISATIITVKSILSPHNSFPCTILTDTSIETAYIITTKAAANIISITGELRTVISHPLLPAGILETKNSVARKPATGIYINTLPLIEPNL